MGLAAEALSTKPELLLIDGNLFRYQIDIPHKCIIGGDAKYSPIAAASILAKTHRDEYMLALAQEYPQYSWHKGMGYPTAAHRKAIAEYGVTPHHRLTFKL